MEDRMTMDKNNPTRLSNIGRTRSDEVRNKIAESKRGSKSHFWEGGKSYEKYTASWTNALRSRVRKRDNNRCAVCNKKQKKRLFHIHHIDYNKKNCTEGNLITLCASCHGKTNSNRSSWIAYFNKGDKTCLDSK